MSTSIVPRPDEYRQLSLDDYQFERIRQTVHDGVVYLSLIDLMAEFSDLETRPDILWKRTRERLEKDGFQYDRGLIILKLKSVKDGKMYKTECADRRTCLRIVQSIPSEKAEPIRQWLARLADEHIEEQPRPGPGTQQSKENAVASLKAQGYSGKSLQHLETRIDSMAGFKSLMETVQRVVDKPQYGKIVNAEYVALFGEIADRLKEILHTDNIRDKLPPLQLASLRLAEVTIEQAIHYHERLTMADLLAMIAQDIVPLGKVLREICERHGVHHVTGQALLTE